MTLTHGELLYEGKAKRIFACKDPQQVLVEFKNDATAFNAQKKAQLENKGRLNCLISACLFELLERHEIPTHYLGVSDDTWMVVQRVDVIPIEVVLRNTAAGSLCRETPISQGTALDPALRDLYYKDDDFGDPLLTDARIALLGVVSFELRQRMEDLVRRVNAVLLPFFKDLGLQLVDFKLEMGLNQAGELLVADEISPDTCRFWDINCADANERILDKDRFRKDLGGVIEAYGEVCKRVQGACPQPRNCR